jgi:DNA helicase HerA-like ATPase
VTVVIGRHDGSEDRPQARLGTYLALDGSEGTTVALDADGPHAVAVVGKRGSGKSYTLGVLAEELARLGGLAPVVIDPMGSFRGLEGSVSDDGVTDVSATVIEDPSVPASALDPRTWCGLLGLSPESGAGSLVWQAATAAGTLAEMAAHVAASDAPSADSRAALNHLRLAASWDIFDPAGLSATSLASAEATVIDLSTLDEAPGNAVTRAIGETLYRARVTDAIDRLPWLLVDEARAFFDGAAAGALTRILRRGRAPGVSLTVATQRPTAIPAVAVSQSDILIAHRLSSSEDREALRGARPSTARGVFEERLPDAPGEALVIDDATESVHTVCVRRRHTPHGAGNPSASSLDGP